MAKRTEAVDAVRLCTEHAAWSQVPPWAREALADAAARARRIREALAAEAPHSWMPPIDLHPRAWVRGTATVDGRAWFLKRRGRWGPGVELPAQVCAYPDTQLRGLLIHEFSHCFERIEHMVEALATKDPGGVALVRDPDGPQDDAADDARHVEAAYWFGPSVSAIPLRGDLDLLPFSGPFLDRWAEAGLPVDDEEPVRKRLDQKFEFDRRVLQHAIAQRERRFPRSIQEA